MTRISSLIPFSILLFIALLPTRIFAVTATPTLTAPASSTAYRVFSINYMLPETPKSGSVTLTFSKTGATDVVLNLQDSAATEVVSFTWDSLTDPALLSRVTSASGWSTALPVGTYSVILSYQNAANDPAATVTNTSVVLRRTSPTPTLTSPSSSSSNSTLSVNYNLNATPLSGSVSLTFAGTSTIVLTMANTDSLSFTLNPALNPTVAYPSYVSSISGGSSIPDGTYTVTLAYSDNLGNPSVSVNSTAVVIDTVSQTPTLTKPASNTTISSIPINFNLPETALSGSRQLTFVSSEHTIVLVFSDATSTDFTLDPTVNPTTNANIVSSTLSSIPDGTYSVTLSYQDALGNSASTATNTGVIVSHATQDSTPSAAASSGCSLQIDAPHQKLSMFGLLLLASLFTIVSRRRNCTSN